jgi:type IV pilus assembly protein PilY1
MGMTFSTPQIAKVQYGAGIKLALVFAAGYHGGWSGNPDDVGTAANEERVGYDDPATKVTEAKEGNAIYVVDADSGALIWKATNGNGVGTVPVGAVEYVDADLDHSISAEINIFDSNNDDIDERAYVPDLGGNVWRIDLPPDDSVDNRGDWQAVRIAALGGTGADDRRFSNAVDVVLGRDESGTQAVDVVLLGSGDRENPKDTTVQNWFFALRDASGSSPPVPADVDPYLIDDLVDSDCFLSAGGLACDDTEKAKLANGWKLQLTQPGEKVLASGISLNNVTYFTSYLPEGEPGESGKSDPCAGFEGSGRVYQVSTFNAAPVKNNNATDDNGNTLPSSSEDQFTPLASAGIPSELVPLGPGHLILPDLSVTSTGSASHYRTYWYERDIDD